ncbi:MAG: M15 family metallopeptidase [Neobacillus sp.]
MKRKRKKTLQTLLYLALLAILFYFYMNPPSQLNQNLPFPTELHPLVKERSDQLVQQAAEKGIVVVITDGFRSAEEQDRLFEKGRSTEGNIVTYARGGESLHNYGLAIDFALRTPTHEVIWDMQYDGNQNGVADWEEVVELAKVLGFDWGGDWARFKDYPHLQMDFGLTLADLQNGKRPPESSLVVDSNPDD